ncbi:MAG: ATP-binding protein, partial [Candidatus Dependentiae bacterium]|nr:ATP-binding protein [Candidatus Dependentiae bacterium]
MKFFNTAGPVNPNDHYCVPIPERIDENEVRLLIEQKKYFILHAPRQTGKTSAMRSFVKTLNREGQYLAL